MRYLVSILAGLMLSGCWLGPQFYTLDDAAQPIAEGRYEVVDVVDPTQVDYGTYYEERIDIAYRADGSVSIADSTDVAPDGVIIAPLSGVRGLENVYVIQMDLGQGVAPVGMSVYGLLNVVDGGYQLALPKCDGTRRLRPGSRIIVSGLLIGGRRCSFPDRQSFEEEMRIFAEDPIRWTEYRRIS